MAVSVKISQLIDGGNIQSQDLMPVARGNETYKVPANQLVIAGQNVGVGTGQLFYNKLVTAGSTLQFRTLSAIEGITVTNRGETLLISGQGQTPIKTKVIGDGSTTSFLLNNYTSKNASNYRVDIDGVLQEPETDFTISDTNILFSTAPPLSSKVVIVSNNLVTNYEIVPQNNSVTTTKIANGAVTPEKLSGQQTGLVPVYGCRTWINFNGANYTLDVGSGENRNTIRGNGNVTKVVRTGLGKYKIYFITPMPNINYAAVVTTDGQHVTWTNNHTTNTLDINVTNLSNVFVDPVNVSVIIIF